MAMPPTPAAQNAVIEGSAAKPTTADIGIAAAPPGVIVTGLTTEFPMVHDVYHDQFMNRITDVGYDRQFVVNCDSEILQKLAAAEDDHSQARDGMFALVEPTALVMIASTDTRGFDDGDWATGIYFLLTEGGGTFERNKPRKDRLKYEFRYYTAA